MWIVCQAEDRNEMPSHIFSEKKNKKQTIRMSSVTISLSILMVNGMLINW